MFAAVIFSFQCFLAIAVINSVFPSLYATEQWHSELRFRYFRILVLSGFKLPNTIIISQTLPLVLTYDIVVAVGL